MTDEGRGPFGNPLRTAFDDLLDRTRVLADSLLTVGTGALGMTPVPSALTGLVTALRQVVEQAPAPTVPLDLFQQEIRAKRAMVQALREQLDAFDAQLGTLERSMAPLQAWGEQWTRVRAAVLGESRPDGPDPAAGGGPA